MTLDIGRSLRLQEVGPCGQEIERRLGALQAWGRANQTIDNAPVMTDTPDNQQTAPKMRHRMRLRAGLGQIPPPTPRLSDNNLSPPVACFMAPHRCPHCDDVPGNIFPYHHTPLMTLTPHPVTKTYFPLTVPHSLTPPHDP